MKWKIIIPAATIAVAAIITVSVIAAGAHGPATPAAPGTSVATGGAAVLPVATNPIMNTSTVPGLTLVGAMAENNVDPATKQPTADRLQVQLKNTSSNPLSGFEIYYTMTEATTKKSESYYLPLTGLTLAAGAETTIFFDNQAGPNHFPENKFSIYRSSKNQVDFTIEVSAKGVAIAKGTAVKGAGTGEVVGG
jgi:hypothetical protein